MNTFFRPFLTTLLCGALLLLGTPAAYAQMIPPAREATPAQVTAGTSKNVYISPYNLRNSDVSFSDVTIAGDDITGVLGLNVTASATANKTLTLASSGTAGNIVFKSGSTTQGTFVGGGGLLMAGATGGNPTLGVINAAGLKINGVDVSTSSDTYWSTVSGGISYGSNVTVGGSTLVGSVVASGASGGYRFDPRDGSGENFLWYNPTGDDARLYSHVTNLDHLIVSATTGNLTVRGSTQTNDITLGTSGPSVKSSLAARAPAQGIVFDGTSGATVTTSALGTDWTVAAWMTLTSFSDYRYACSGGTPATANQPGCVVEQTTGNVIFYDGVSVFTPSPTLTLTAGKSALVIWRLSGGTLYASVNGGTESSVAMGSTIGAVTTIGSNLGATQKFDGILRVNIFNRSLSSSDRLALYERGAVDPSDINSAGTDIKGSSVNYAKWYGTGTISSGAPNGFTFDAGASELFARKTGATGISIEKGKRYRISITVSGATAGSVSYYLMENGGGGPASNSVTGQSDGTLVNEFTATKSDAAAGVVVGASSSGGATVTINSIVCLGALLATDATQAGAGTTWRDVSGNSAHITLGTGCSWALPSSGYVGDSTDVAGTLRASSYKDYTTGAGVEVFYNSSTPKGFVLAYDRGASAYKDLRIGGNTVELWSGGSVAATFSTSQNTTLAGNLTVSGTGTSTFNRAGNSGSVLSLLSGNASNYVDIALGRASAEHYIGTAATTNNYVTGTAAGDLAINVGSGQKLVIGVNSAQALSLNATAATLTGSITVNGGTSTVSGAAYPSFIANGTSGGSINLKKSGVGYGTLYSNDTNLVLDSEGAANLLLLTGGATRATITSTGTTLGGNLTVSGTGTSTFGGSVAAQAGALSATNTGGGTGASSALYLNSSSSYIGGTINAPANQNTFLAFTENATKRMGLETVAASDKTYLNALNGHSLVLGASTDANLADNIVISTAGNVSLSGSVTMVNDKTLTWGDTSTYIQGNSTSDTIYLVAGSGTGINSISQTGTTLGGNLTASGTGNHTFGTTNTVTFNAGNITVAGSGALATTGAVISTNGTLSSVAPGTSGNVLTSNGTTWTSAAPAAATYAEIYVADGSTAQSIPTGSTYTKVTAFTTDGAQNNCTAAAASDKITITAVGTYRITWGISLTSDTNNVTWTFAPFQGGTELTKGEVGRKTGTGADVGDCGRSCLLTVSSVPLDIDLRVKHNAVGSVLLTPVHCNLNVTRIN